MKERVAGFILALMFSGWVFYPVAYRYTREKLATACATYQMGSHDYLCQYVK